MKTLFAKFLLAISIALIALSICMLVLKREPFYTFFFLFAWSSYIGILDSWLYLKGGESLFIEHPIDFLTFLIPASALIWFTFELFNLRLANWYYVGVTPHLAARWLGYFFSFGTVLPGIFLTANFLDYYGIFRRNDFSQFFSTELPSRTKWSSIGIGSLILILPLLLPKYFFPLIWGAFLFLLDPINAEVRGKSLIQEWRSKNWNRTLQLLLAGLICGFWWESWNFWAGAKWVYSVPLPDALLKNLKIFEMPILGFLGFALFALECFVMTESLKKIRESSSKKTWRLFSLTATTLMLLTCWLIDHHTVHSFR